MAPHYQNIHNKFKYNGHHFSFSELKTRTSNLIKDDNDFEKDINDFFIEWVNEKKYVLVNTSGSTGKPKQIKLPKQTMVNSAIATGVFFDLKPGNKIVNCLPMHYIAGKMMLVRAMVLGLEIDCVAPNTNPVFDYSKAYSFSAMVPMQVEAIISKTINIKTIIIGGSSVSEKLKEKLKNGTTLFYETYGMTETATHVALKSLNFKNQKNNNCFLGLPNVSFTKDNRDCLIISAPNLITQPIITNDIVDLKTNTSFKWLGRFDNVINSGGVKLFPEQIENKLNSVIANRFFVSKQSDETLGQRLILIVENLEESEETLLTKIKAIKSLNKFQIPKKIYSTKRFIETSSGKIQRNKTLNLILG